MGRNKQEKITDVGATLIETLVALAILAIVISSAAVSIAVSMHGNNIARTYGAVAADVQAFMENYRGMQYSDLLNLFGKAYTDILHNESVVAETSSSSTAWADYTVTLTAIKRSTASLPDAVKIRVDVTQRRGIFGSDTISFESIISEAKAFNS